MNGALILGEGQGWWENAMLKAAFPPGNIIILKHSTGILFSFVPDCPTNEKITLKICIFP